ncbi:response regulator transcription factor [Paraburkholderia madseniana]|uniref:winged helix-turn-helix domain-containing protein n=1 Tax=Paraburkholderia madseniana TaxID=2599607 RepID=UPI001558BFE1|nr:response regulator transcription factor [Paraburkholderia madseniana]NPT68549.1 DNA-binding response regulator [Paraburkholderia madseniana]
MRFALVTEDSVLTRDLAGCLASDLIVVEPFNGELPLMRAMRTTAYDLVLIDAKNTSLLLNSLLSWRNCNAAVCTPVIVLTPFANWTAMLGWINAGATDVAYRYDLEQVRLRAHVALQRETCRAGADTIELGRYALRRDVGLLALDGVEIPLTPREFTMAWLFFSNPGRFLSRAQIASSVWGSCENVASRSIEQHIYKLRKKLRLSPASGLNLKTVYALGYKLDPATSISQPDDVQAGTAAPCAARPSRGIQSDAEEQSAEAANA